MAVAIFVVFFSPCNNNFAQTSSTDTRTTPPALCPISRNSAESFLVIGRRRERNTQTWHNVNTRSAPSLSTGRAQTADGEREKLLQNHRRA